MPRYTDDPVKHIISCRLNEEERRELYQLASDQNMTISAMVREGLILYMEMLKLKQQGRVSAVRFQTSTWEKLKGSAVNQAVMTAQEN